MAFAFIHERKNPSLLKFSAIPCNLEYCEDVFDSAKELEKHSPVLMEAARNYSEVAHCIPLRSRVQCLKQQEKQCLHHFQYKVQVVGLQKIMDILKCSNNTSAAVFDPSTMGRLFLTFIIYMQASIMDILKSSNNISAAVFDPSTMGRLFLAFIINMGASLRLLVFR